MASTLSFNSIHFIWPAAAFGTHRTILQKRTVVLLDEVTGGIDTDTDHILEDVMEGEFKGLHSGNCSS